MPSPEQAPFAPPDAAPDETHDEADFVFRFSLEPLAAGEVGYDDPLLELIRGQLADLLDAVILTNHGERVRVDGFRLLQDPDTQWAIWPDRTNQD
jgi:hypothetical protein